MTQYYYIDRQGAQVGPVDINQLQAAGIGPDTMVWRDGLAQWMQAAQVDELAHLVSQFPPRPQAQAAPAHAPAEKPQNWLWLAICATVLCCMPAGVVSLIYSTKVDPCWQQGQYEEAIENSRKAKNWAIGSIIAGVVFSVIYIGFLVAVNLASLY